MLAVLDKLIKCTLVINVTDSEIIELRPEWPRVRRFERPYKRKFIEIGKNKQLDLWEASGGVGYNSQC